MNSMNEPSGIFALIMAIAVVAPYLSDFLGVPVVASMTLIGILLGPQVLGILEPNILIQFVGSLGLIYVFFSAGTEVNVGILKKRAKSVIIFGLLTFFIPFLFGIAFGLVLFGQRLISALLLGAFFASSGSLVIQPILRSELLSRESAEVARGGASISRILVAVVIFFAGIVFPEGGIMPAARTLGLSAAYFLGLYLILPRLASIVIRKTRAQGSIDAVFILFLLFASATFGLYVGVPGYIGAFFAGLLIAPAFSSSKSIASRIDLLGDSLFLPFLLVFIGASADFSQVPSLPLAAALVVGSTLCGLGSKFLAAYIAGKILRFSRADRGLLFGFSSTFAAFSLAVASVAGSTGFFDQPLVNGAIILVILSSMASSLAARNSGSSILQEKTQEPQHPSMAGKRIMVALSKPGSAHNLMDLGIALHRPESGSPLFPLAIISETEAGDESRQHAESMLAAAIMQGASPQISVIPISRVEVNVAQGILDSAAEHEVDTIIIGWNRPPRLANAFFGSIIDQIINGGNQMVLVARTVAPFTASHIVALLPSLCDRHEGFSRAAMALGAIAAKSQAKLHILTLSGEGSRLARALKAGGYAAQVQTIEVESWKDTTKAIRQLPAGPKLFALFSARPSEPSWHPAIERLPHRIGEEFPETNLLMMYMANSNAAAEVIRVGEAGVPASLPHRFPDILGNAIERGNVRVDMKHGAIADGIFELVSSAFPFDRKLSGRLSAKLTEIVQRQPIEIQQGVVLIHDRVEDIESPIVCLGSHRQGFRISLLEKPVKVIIIILVPEKESPEDHLAFLGEIAHLFKEKDLAQRLVNAEKPEDIL
ncbi:MAG: cation:proton antiporter [Rectinemataceae bacterium]|nr:cation:proton antiporter [Rectinemataceae bacterium]